MSGHGAVHGSGVSSGSARVVEAFDHPARRGWPGLPHRTSRSPYRRSGRRGSLPTRRPPPVRGLEVRSAGAHLVLVGGRPAAPKPPNGAHRADPPPLSLRRQASRSRPVRRNPARAPAPPPLWHDVAPGSAACGRRPDGRRRPKTGRRATTTAARDREAHRPSPSDRSIADRLPGQRPPPLSSRSRSEIRIAVSSATISGPTPTLRPNTVGVCAPESASAAGARRASLASRGRPVR